MQGKAGRTADRQRQFWPQESSSRSGASFGSACVVGCALLAMLFAGCSGGETRKRNFIAQGESFMAERNWEKARLEFRNALQIDPQDTRVQYLAGQAAERSGEFRESVALYQSVVKAEPDNRRARADLARLLLFGGLRREAGELIDAGLARAKEDPDLLTLRAALRAQAGEREGARADAEAAARGAPDNESAAAVLASLMRQDGRVAEAIAVVERVVARNPQSVDLRIVLAELQLGAGNRAAAERELKRVIAAEPREPGHRYRLAQFHVIGREIDAAERVLREAVRLSPEDLRPKLALANLVATQRSFEAGERSLLELVGANADDLQLQMGLGQFYESHRRFDTARGVYRRVIERDGTGVRGLAARNRLAAIEMQTNQPDAARRLVEEVLAESARDNDALILRANLNVAQGDAAGAVTDLRAVLRDQPYSQPLQRALAQAYLANKDEGLAEETLRSAMRANPRDIQTRLALAQFLIQHERPDEAQPVVDQLVREQPGDVPSLEAAFRVQMARRDFVAARRTAEAVRTTRPDLPVGYFLSGLAEQADGQLEPARLALEDAIRRAPDAVEPLTAVLRVDVAQGQVERAIARIDGVIARYPTSAPIRNLKGDVLASLKRPAEAVRAYGEAIERAPSWWLPWHGMALAEFAGGRREAAVTAYRRGIEATKGAPQLIIELAALHERLGEPDAAIAQYESWIRRDAKSEIAANNLAMLLISHRRDHDSLARAASLTGRFNNSGNPAFLDTYAWVRYVQGNFAAAVPPLQRAVDLAPRSPLLRARLGLAQFRAGQRAAAKSNLETAFRQAPRLQGLDEARAALAELQRGG